MLDITSNIEDEKTLADYDLDKYCVCCSAACVFSLGFVGLGLRLLSRWSS